MTVFWIVSAVIAAAAVYYFNRLVGQVQRVNEGWSGIDVQLKRRADLIPALVETVKGYAKHEEGLLTRVTELRAKAVAEQQDSDLTARNAAESGLSSSIGKLFAVIENYPELKADNNFRELQNSLVDIEDQLQFARRYYNGTVRDMNILANSFPGNIVAKLGKFGNAQFFEIDNPLEQYAPKVDLETDKKDA
ncbi:MAG: LemA family protein [Pseudomonadota bacterium]|jgi:LemA protein|nr:LemA family protein [Pseudomonadota bacterium]QKK06376.1 MAG: LemA family protein [Pseudomonadota bacterium]